MHQLGWYRRAFGPLWGLEARFSLYRVIEVFMEQKIGLDQAAYVRLSVSSILATLCILGTFGASVYGFVEALGDSNGGGWLMLIILMLGVYFLPTIISWIVQVIMYVMGRSRYKKGNMPLKMK